MQIQANIGDTVYDPGEKRGNNYPDLEPGYKFWNWVRVPGSGYKSVTKSKFLSTATKICLFPEGLTITITMVTCYHDLHRNAWQWKIRSCTKVTVIHK